MPEITAIGARDPRHAALCDVLGRAFADDPGFVHVFPDPGIRAAALSVLQGARARMHAEQGGTDLLHDGARVLGGAIWRGPEDRFGLGAWVRFGMLRLPRTIGWRGLWRLLALSDEISDLRLAQRSGPHWFLDTLAVDPSVQGRGLGRRLLEHGLSTRVDAAGLPCRLLTSNPENLPFYLHFGFEQVAEKRVGEAGGHVTWLLRRPAAPPG